MATGTSNYVLIVDDDERVNAYISRALELEGFGTVTARDAEEAWSSLIRERPAVAIIDLGLAGTDGWSLIKRMRSDPRFAGLPVLVITGQQAEDLDERARQLGCGSLRKPFEPPELLEHLRKVMVRAFEVVLMLDTARVEGVVHVPPSINRFSDAWEAVMGDGRRFIPLTDVVVYVPQGETVVDKLPFLQVSKDRIWGVTPGPATS